MARMSQREEWSVVTEQLTSKEGSEEQHDYVVRSPKMLDNRDRRADKEEKIVIYLSFHSV